LRTVSDLGASVDEVVPFQRQHGLWNRLCDMESRSG
jgi:hypothetical protein